MSILDILTKKGSLLSKYNGQKPPSFNPEGKIEKLSSQLDLNTNPSPYNQEGNLVNNINSQLDLSSIPTKYLDNIPQ